MNKNEPRPEQSNEPNKIDKSILIIVTSQTASLITALIILLVVVGAF